MKKTRMKMFETNSSSVHCICIANNKSIPQNIPNVLRCQTGEYGWENKKYHDVYDKADYLLTMIYCKPDPSGYLKRLKNILSKYGIALNESKSEWYYIDHDYEWGCTVDEILDDEESLMNFLFNPSSFVETSNDNGDADRLESDCNDAKASGYKVYMKYN